jgi:hypothetical protein
VWERALTQVDLATALAATGDRTGAEEAGAAATATFEALGAGKDLETARTMLAEL